jgi:tetrahydromethanopterin S-methyltransferase subunit G
LSSATKQEKIKIMTLRNAHDYFERLIARTNKKSEIKVYKEFVRIITRLEKRELTETEIQLIETYLDALNLNSTSANTRKYFNNALEQFEKFLKETFSLTTKDYYTKIGTALGISFGILFGTVFLSSLERSMGLSLGMMAGMFIGLTIGRMMDSHAEASGNMV